MTGRAYMGEVLIQIHEEMSELLDKQMNVQKEFEKTSRVHTSSRKPMKKCAMKMKEKNDCCIKNFFCGRKDKS